MQASMRYCITLYFIAVYPFILTLLFLVWFLIVVFPQTVAILSENQRSQSHSIGSIVDDKELRNSDMGSIR